MKRQIIFLLLLFLATGTSAQKRLLMFDEYTHGPFLLKNRAKIKSNLNYDAANNTIMYMENGDEMILTNLYEVDTVYIGEHKYIPLQNIFAEIIPTPHGSIYVRWQLKEKYIGKQGAYGTVSQGTIARINTAEFQHGVYENQPVEVYKEINNNEYYIIRKKKALQIKSEKALLKLFPDQQAVLKEFIKHEKVNFANTDDALKLIAYAMSL